MATATLEGKLKNPMLCPAAGAPAWSRALAFLDDQVDRVVQYLFVGFIAMFAAVMLLGVFFRYVLNNSLAWSDELALIIFAWGIFLAISSAYLHDQHVHVGIIMDHLPRTWHDVLSVVAEGLSGGYLISLVVAGIQAMSVVSTTHTDAMRWPYSIPYTAIPLSCVIMLLHWIRRNSWQGITPGVLVKVGVALSYFWIVVLPFGQYVQLTGGVRFLVLFLMMFGPMLIGVPVAFALGLMATFYLGMFGDVPFETGAMQVFFGINNVTLIAIPLLIFSGKIMHSAGIAGRIVDFAQVIVGRIRGGLGATDIVASFLFGDISGSAVSDCAAIGTLMIPQMKARGYRADFCAALQGAAGTLGLTAPLAITVLLYSTATSGSVSRLAAATIVPATLLAGSFMVVTLLHARRWRYPAEHVPAKEYLPRTLKALPGIFALVVVLGGIVGGIVTPAEVGTVLLTYVLLLSIFLYHTAKPGQLFQAGVEAGHVAAMTLFMVATSSFLGFVLARDLVSIQLVDFVTAISTNKYMIILLVNVVFIILGMVLEGPAIIYGFLPSFMPLLTRVGVDPIQFGVLLCLNLGIGQIHPPVGLTLFVGTQLAETTTGRAMIAALPFMAIMLVDMVLVAVFPQISLELPHILFGYPIH